MNRTPTLAVWLLVLNLIGVACFLILLLVVPPWTNLEVRTNFYYLDQGGAIEVEALGKFHPSHGFTNEHLEYRRTVPEFIARPSLTAERRNAAAGAIFTGLNALVLSIHLAWARLESDQGKGKSLS